MEVVIQKTKTDRITEVLMGMSVHGRRLMDLSDRRAAMVIAGQLKKYSGRAFMTTVKEQPEGKFAIMRIK